jgi:phosphoglycerate dehydrogenase-like enzyme
MSLRVVVFPDVIRAGLAHEQVEVLAPEQAGDGPIDVVVLAPDATQGDFEWVRGHSIGLVQLLSAGFEKALGYLPPGSRLANAKGVYDPGVSEWALAAVLAMQREFPRELRAQDRGIWDRRVTGSLHGRTVAILGYGAIGRAFEGLLAAFDVRVLRVDAFRADGVHPVSALPQVAKETDILVSFLPADPSTDHLISAEVLASLPDGALVVNCGRGSVLDSAALEAELRAGRLRSALDVMEIEPIPPDATLWSAPNLLLSPHVAGQTDQADKRRLALVQEQVARLVAGQPPINLVETG